MTDGMADVLTAFELESDDSDVKNISDANDVSGVVLGVNDVSDDNDVSDSLGVRNVLDVDLGQLTVWSQGSDDSGVVLGVDLGQLTVWGQGNDVFGRFRTF